MPKRGARFNQAGNNGGMSRFSVLKEYEEHDDRDRDNNRARNSTRRVSFKQTAPTKDAGLKRRVQMIRKAFEGDEDMDDFATSSQFDGGRMPRRKGSPIPRGDFGGTRKLMPSSLGWYHVTVQSGQRYSKDDTIRAILNAISPDIFIPHYWRTEKNCIAFFVDDFNVAERLQRIDRPIQMSDGYRLTVRVRCGCPIVSVDEQFKERMKVVMSKRYDAVRRALDMSKFHADPDFKNMFCGLFRTPVMSAALDIIEKHIPDLEAWNLNDNSINTLENFKNVQTRLPHLKILYLGDNKIASLASLFVLRNVPIVELVLKGNPLCQRYKEHTLYVRYLSSAFSYS